LPAAGFSASGVAAGLFTHILFVSPHC